MSHKIFDNDLVAMRKSKVTLTLNKPAYVGMCILDLSKVLVYEFHYDYIKQKYGNNSRLLFTDVKIIILKTFIKILISIKKRHLSQNIIKVQTKNKKFAII